MTTSAGAFRFTYFTDKYSEIYEFYEQVLQFKLEHDWDRSDEDKGALFKAERGLIEILLLPPSAQHRSDGLDYRSPQGVFMCIQSNDIDSLYVKYKSKNVPFKQEITDQAWGHRTFSITEPNGLVLYFFEERF